MKKGEKIDKDVFLYVLQRVLYQKWFSMVDVGQSGGALGGENAKTDNEHYVDHTKVVLDVLHNWEEYWADNELLDLDEDERHDYVGKHPYSPHIGEE